MEILKFNVALNSFDRAGEIKCGLRGNFGVVLKNDKIFVLGGIFRTGISKSVRMKLWMAIEC